jgi:glycyl-tRNA synthetase beta subunit
MAEYFFELLTEEIPAWMHDAAQTTLRQQLSEIVPGADVYVSSTPRRIIFFLSKLPLRENDREGTRAGDRRRTPLAEDDAMEQRRALVHPSDSLRALALR